ncbi:MAG: hypothetical protein K9N55_01750 [Phycisphaerae bacterium]|nr:hypothetical protein [Phycisphaerae bacterium]
MKKQENTPLWVYLAFANIETQRGALMMVWCNVLCSIYCIPWSQCIRDSSWIGKIFVIEGWLWFAVMAAITLWYWAGLKWIDRHDAWSQSLPESD